MVHLDIGTVPFVWGCGTMFGYGYCTIQLSIYRVIWLWVLFLSVVYIMIPFCSLVPFVCVGMYHSAVGMILISCVYSFICCIYNRPTIRLSCGCGCDTVSLRVLYSQVVGVPGTLSLHIMVPSDIFFRSLHMTTLSGADLALWHLTHMTCHLYPTKDRVATYDIHPVPVQPPITLPQRSPF